MAMKKTHEVKFRDYYDDLVLVHLYKDDPEMGPRAGVTPMYEDSLVCCRAKARELAAILTHFADTGELPGENLNTQEA